MLERLRRTQRPTTFPGPFRWGGPLVLNIFLVDAELDDGEKDEDGTERNADFQAAAKATLVPLAAFGGDESSKVLTQVNR